MVLLRKVTCIYIGENLKLGKTYEKEAKKKTKTNPFGDLVTLWLVLCCIISYVRYMLCYMLVLFHRRVLLGNAIQQFLPIFRASLVRIGVTAV